MNYSVWINPQKTRYCCPRALSAYSRSLPNDEFFVSRVVSNNKNRRSQKRSDTPLSHLALSSSSRIARRSRRRAVSCTIIDFRPFSAFPSIPPSKNNGTVTFPPRRRQPQSQSAISQSIISRSNNESLRLVHAFTNTFSRDYSPRTTKRRAKNGRARARRYPIEDVLLERRMTTACGRIVRFFRADEGLAHSLYALCNRPYT